MSDDEQRAHYGEWDANNLFGNIDWDTMTPAWISFNASATYQINERRDKRDFLCLLTGAQKPIADMLETLVLPVEWAVGYEGIATPFRVFESYAWMHHVYGLAGIKDGLSFDAVIPNFFDPADFPHVRAGRGGDYLLFMGRLVQRKGLTVASLIAERVGMPLYVVGPGATEGRDGYVSAPEVTIEGEHIRYIGPVGREQRAELLAGAAVTLVPTQYIEPFGGVAVEAMMSGCPVVTTDWGAFTETVQEGVSGYRFRTLGEAARAVELSIDLDSEVVRQYALDRYSLDAVFPRFDAHFQRLSSLWTTWDGELEGAARVDGWYA